MGTRILAPRSASQTLTGTSQCTLSPLRTKKGCSWTRVLTTRSPRGPPKGAALPSPGTRSCMPASTPGGISTWIGSVTLRTPTVDGSKLASVPGPAGKEREKYWGFGFNKMPVNGRVWYPEGEGPFPLVLIVHGNHNMREFSDPGYAYLGELLASRGFILVSVDENFLNGGIRGENDARGWMLLQHLRQWRRFNDSTGSPFAGKVGMA